MYDICCIGHITLDKIITPGSCVEMPGGTSFYFSNALQQMDLEYVLITAPAQTEKRFAEALRTAGTDVHVFDSRQTVCFENIYESDMDHRVQKVWAQSDPFQVQHLEGIDARIYHLGPLLAGDIPATVIRHLADKGRLSLDVQGFLRDVKDNAVYSVDWSLKKELLPYIDIIKANAEEMSVLTNEDDLYKGAEILGGWGVKEVLITRGSEGSLVYERNQFHEIPAFINGEAVDATGCGDTFMAGYLYKRIKDIPPREAALFASAMAGLKVTRSGPFNGSEKEVMSLLDGCIHQ